MKTSELKEKPLAELETELLALLREQFNLKMQRGSGQTAKPHLFKKVRRDIARIKTVANEMRRVS